MAQQQPCDDCLAGGGEMGALMRAHDWASSSLGPVAHWPQSLKAALRIILGSRYPMFVWWGRQMIMFHNDAYVPILGKRHPEALGKSGPEVWSEIWDEIRPLMEPVLDEGRACWAEERLLIMERNGYAEEAYFTFSYSPIPDDQGGVGGIFCACSEDTVRVLGQRRLRTLRELAEGTLEARSVEDACEIAARVLDGNRHDIPFALIYLADEGTAPATLVGVGGLRPGSPACPTHVSLSAGEDAVWPLRAVLQRGRAVRVDDLPDGLQDLPGAVWPDPPKLAVVAPIRQSGQDRLAGFLIVGTSPRRIFDDDYQGFVELLAGHIATAIANARAYEQERRRAEALAELDRAKTAFFSNVSHEFRTPLTLLLGPVEDALGDQEEPLTPRHRERLEIAHRNTLRLQKLVNTLLDFSRIEAGRVEASYEPTDLVALTAELASNFRSACDKASLALHVQCESLEQPVYVDRDMWEKIVLNLLSNAFKYTFRGSIDVMLRKRERHAELTVKDTGTGIPPAHMPRLFERFHRVAGARGRTQEGSGIGLALVRELVRLHGGEVTATSEIGKGSAFTVTIPFGTNHLPSDRINAERTLTSSALGAAPFVEEALRWLPDENSGTAFTNPRLPPEDCLGNARVSGSSVKSRPRVLLADDNADMRDYVRRLLSPRYEVLAVSDGDAALAAARAHTVDLVLSDVMMPGLDGFALLRALRADQQTRETPVVLLSARAGEEARVEGLEAGADDYLTKPFSAKELLARVSAHVELARVRQESAAALRESEARFRHMADNAPVMIWVTDASGACTYLNDQWYRFTGTTPEQGLGFDWLLSVHPDDREIARAAFLQANADHAPVRIEYRLRRADGEYRWAIDSALPRFGPQGEFCGYIGSVLDITDLKRIEKRLREVDRRKDEFLATLAHELRNPLAPIRSGLEVLRLAGNDAAVWEETIGIMERQIQQMVRLIEDLMDVSRITRGRIGLRKRPCVLGDIVDGAVESSRPALDGAGVVLSTSVPPEPINMNADPTRLAQVLANLLNNASKFTPRGGHVWLTVTRDDNEVVIRVRDDGVGMHSETISEIFDMFVQVDNSLDRSPGGLGIGLSLVRALVELHGGTIQAHSEGLGHGSEFVLRLPTAQTNVNPAIRNHVPRSPLSLPARRVLVVDDNVDAADTLARMLDMTGSEVQVAHDGLEAVEMATRFRPEIILLDIGLPKLNGYDAARTIRQLPWGREVTLIALTGWGQRDDQARTRQAGFDHHLVKPVEPAALQAVLCVPQEAKSTERVVPSPP